jgi:hypothetical protein
MSMVETLEAAPDNSDGMTIDGAVGDLSPVEAAAVPISKLPVIRQFDVLKSHYMADADHSRAWRTRATEEFAFRAGEQWTDEDKALLADQKRPHIVFNRVLTILKAVAGMEINGRHETSFLPRGTEDTAVNEVLSAASKWMGDETDGEDEESAAFDKCATCGMGWVENRMSYEDNPAGLYVEESLDPREMVWDRTAKKKGLKDARRMARARRMPISDALAMFPGKTRVQLDAVWAADFVGDYPTKSLEEKRRRDSDNTESQVYDDLCEVTLVQIQWIEREPYYLVADIQQNSKSELTEREYQVFQLRMKALGMPVHAARLVRKVYKSAWLGGEMLKAAGPSPIKGKFSWDCITGEYDASTGTWFGLVKVMRDPQMWANKWLSQILHILNSTAKGGILAETSAFDDQREAEDGYAQADQITWLADGALSGDKPKVMAKPGAGVTDGYLGLMTFAISSIKDVTGINLELLGQQDQNQPGIIEAMRKQAGMTVLATLFDALRYFRKNVGRSRLYFIQNFLSDGRLIRVVGPDEVQAVRLAKEQVVGEYDVIVDDTPTSPNQKEANWAIIQPMMALFKEELTAQPEVLGILLEYSPLPSRIVEAIKGFIKQRANDPQAQQKQQLNEKLSTDLIVSEISKNQSVAEMNNAKAGATQATAMYDIAMAKNMLAKNDMSGLQAHLDMMESAAKARTAAADARKSDAEAAHTEVKTQREAAGIGHDAVQSQAKLLTARVAAHRAGTERHKATVGLLVDHLSGVAGMHRDIAGAAKDHAQAGLLRRTPAPMPSAPAP